jgi:hypothetical protein
MAKSVEPDENVSETGGGFRPDDDERSIWETIDDIMRQVPEEVLSRLPADGAEQHDRYLYGSPGKVPRKL